MYKNAKWINTSVTLLVLLSFAELIFTITLLLLFNDILYHLGGHYSTVGGFVASLITLPSSFKIKTSYSSTEFKSHLQDVVSYHKFVLSASFAMQCIASILCLHSFVEISHSTHSFSAIMKHYNKRVENKVLVDTVQLLLQCCGTHSYEEWLEHNNEVSCVTAIDSDLLLMPKKEENFYKIPYSCCFINSKTPCENYDIVNLGTETINKKGCSRQIVAFLLSVSLSEITLYGFVATTIGACLWVMNFKELNNKNENVPKPKFSRSSLGLDITNAKIQEMLDKKGIPESRMSSLKNSAKNSIINNRKESPTEKRKPIIKDTSKSFKIFETGLSSEKIEEKKLQTPSSSKKRVEFTPNQESPPLTIKTDSVATPSKKSTPKTPIKPKILDSKILDPKQSQSTNTIKPKLKNDVTQVQLFLEEEFSNLSLKTKIFTD